MLARPDIVAAKLQLDPERDRERLRGARRTDAHRGLVRALAAGHRHINTGGTWATADMA
jgi:hypothetical protein